MGQRAIRNEQIRVGDRYRLCRLDTHTERDYLRVRGQIARPLLAEGCKRGPLRFTDEPRGPQYRRDPSPFRRRADVVRELVGRAIE